MEYLRIPNWKEFQHYKKRNPPWIKLHTQLLSNYNFSCLQDASKAHLMLIWLLRSQCDDGIPNDPSWIQKRIGSSTKPDIKLFIHLGFLECYQDASTPLATCISKTETETETETETDKPPLKVPPKGTTTPKKANGHKGTRLPADWTINGELLAWMLDNVPDLNVNHTADSFRDYWIAQPGQKGFKTDWPATFRNWCRRASKDSGRGKPQSAASRFMENLKNA